MIPRTSSLIQNVSIGGLGTPTKHITTCPTSLTSGDTCGLSRVHFASLNDADKSIDPFYQLRYICFILRISNAVRLIDPSQCTRAHSLMIPRFPGSKSCSCRSSVTCKENNNFPICRWTPESCLNHKAPITWAPCVSPFILVATI